KNLYKKTGIIFEVLKVCDKDRTKKDKLKIPSSLFTTDPNQIINSPDIDIIVELTGTLEDAFEYISEGIKNGKSIVTANKALLSERGKEIFGLCEKYNVYIGFEASVAGSIPVIKVIRESFIGNNISKLLGILNGTTNFILSKMSNSNIDFNTAVKIAKEKGYAEANPYFDISGLDSSHKLSILARLIFNKNISWKDIYTEGIEKVEKIDIEFAKELGYKLKLLGIAKKENNFCELRVHPALLPENHPLCSVEDVYNAIYLEGDLIGKSLLYGKGAGGNPAASAVISDIVDIGMKIKMGNYKNIKFEEDSGLKLLPFDEIKTKYYFRFTCLDKPGVLAKIAKVLGENDISIASVIQKKESPKKAIPVVMLTHLSKEKNVSKALKLIDRLDVIKKPTVRIRVEENGSI
ncbi:MAG TPA: homoserine dehydrogenase, partial [Firmicutes bacterium]|nr:homoserine dehydrogenase [Bacillota bacterium]